MKQMKIPDSVQVAYNYEAPGVPNEVKELRPALFRDGGDYCCILGPDEQTGIFGCGISLEDALSAWMHNLAVRITQPADDDEVALYAIDVLKASNKKVW